MLASAALARKSAAAVTKALRFVLGGTIAIAIVFLAFATAPRWAPDEAFLAIILFPAALMLAAMPVAYGALLAIVNLTSGSRRVADIAAAAAGAIVTAIVVVYLHGYLT